MPSAPAAGRPSRRPWLPRPAALLLAALVALVACDRPAERPVGPAVTTGARLRVVATTSIIGDLVRQVAGDAVDLDVLMGPGVDPHLYKASEGDVQRMAEADIVFYNGLHLEGKMVDVLGAMNAGGRRAVAVAEAVPDARRIKTRALGGVYDPHVWFNVELWRHALATVNDTLSTALTDPQLMFAVRARAQRHDVELEQLHGWVRQQIGTLDRRRLALVTAHDAFNYFGAAYGLNVRGLLGISTASEAGARDVQDLAAFIVRRRIPAIFVETTVPERFVRALEDAVRARGMAVAIGGSLYSDALGDAGGPAGTYVGMVRYNVQTIVQALGAGPAAATP